MPTTPYMMKNAGASLVRLIIVLFIVMAAVVGYVFYQSYHGRQELAKAELRARQSTVITQRAACERGKKDRKAAVRKDSAILRAFRDTDMRNPDPITAVRRKSEEDIEKGIADVRSRANIDCTTAFPDAKDERR